MSDRNYFDDSTVALGTIVTLVLLGIIATILAFG